MNNEIIKRKIIKVSAQRHLVIPKEYYDVLGIGEEVKIELHEGQLVIKPVVKVDEDFAEKLVGGTNCRWLEWRRISSKV